MATVTESSTPELIRPLLAPAPDGRALFSREAYHRMAEVLNSGPRVELIDGEIFVMSPIGPPQGWLITRLMDFFTRSLPSTLQCRVQLPIAANDDSEPEPDVAIVRRREDDYRHEHPAPADVALIIEVSQSSLAFDLGRKQKLYAETGIPEYWVVEVDRRILHVHRQPSGDRYQGVVPLEPGSSVSPLAVPGCELDLTWLFR